MSGAHLVFAGRRVSHLFLLRSRGCEVFQIMVDFMSKSYSQVNVLAVSAAGNIEACEHIMLETSPWSCGYTNDSIAL